MSLSPTPRRVSRDSPHLLDHSTWFSEDLLCAGFQTYTDEYKADPTLTFNGGHKKNGSTVGGRLVAIIYKHLMPDVCQPF